MARPTTRDAAERQLPTGWSQTGQPPGEQQQFCTLNQPESLTPVPPVKTHELPVFAGGNTVAIASDTDIVTARQQGRKLSSLLGFSPTEATLVATAISELACNIILYATTGEIVLRALEDGGRRGILVIARDEGPGIPDVRQAMVGGYSTSGGLGLGLCGVKRLVDDFEIVSRVGKGTTVTVRKWRQ
jgi:serine/threonine-protein kinase RsbT